MTDALRERGVALQRFGVLVALVGLSVQLGPYPDVGFVASLAGGVVGFVGLLTAWDAATRRA